MSNDDETAAMRARAEAWWARPSNCIAYALGNKRIPELAAEFAATEVARALAEERAKVAAPVPMVLHCPDCRARHIDEGDFATKPHHTHSCQSCGLTWRPAVVHTVGVQFLPGFKNAPTLEQLVAKVGPLASTGMASAGQAAGLYRKFTVERSDGSSAPGMKHEYCEYFVLDWEHDKFAVPAALAYAKACELEFPALARDLRDRAGAAVARMIPARTEPINPAPNLSPGLTYESGLWAAVVAGARAVDEPPSNLRWKCPQCRSEMFGQYAGATVCPVCERPRFPTEEVPAADRAALMADADDATSPPIGTTPWSSRGMIIVDKSGNRFGVVETPDIASMIVDAVNSFWGRDVEPEVIPSNEAAGNVPAPDTTGPTAARWRCLRCKAESFDLCDPSWRWNGINAEHKCPDLHPQAGHMECELFVPQRTGVGPGPEGAPRIGCGKDISLQSGVEKCGKPGRYSRTVYCESCIPEGAPAAPASEDGPCEHGEKDPDECDSCVLDEADVARLVTERDALKARVAELEARCAAQDKLRDAVATWSKRFAELEAEKAAALAQVIAFVDARRALWKWLNP